MCCRPTTVQPKIKSVDIPTIVSSIARILSIFSKQLPQGSQRSSNKRALKITSTSGSWDSCTSKMILVTRQQERCLWSSLSERSPRRPLSLSVTTSMKTSQSSQSNQKGTCLRSRLSAKEDRSSGPRAEIGWFMPTKNINDSKEPLRFTTNSMK